MGADGGGLDNLGFVSVSGTSFTANSSSFGGGLLNLGSVSLSGGAFTSNTAASDGGGLANNGTATVSALIVSKAVAAIDTVSGFASSDGTNVGATTVLSDNARVRVAVDLYAVLLLGAVQAQFGVTITPYQSATGNTILSAANIPGILANRINAAPAASGIQELKEWMALLSYEATGLGGSIGSEYSSAANFALFGTSGAAVQVRNAAYPLASIGQLVATVHGLLSVP